MLTWNSFFFADSELVKSVHTVWDFHVVAPET